MLRSLINNNTYSKNGRDLLIKTLNSPTLSCSRMWSTGEILLLSTFKCGLQTIIWIHLVFLIYFSWSWANIIKNNQQLSLSLSLLCNNNIARFVYIFLQGSLYILYSLASFTFLLLPIVMLYLLNLNTVLTELSLNSRKIVKRDLLSQLFPNPDTIVKSES